MAQFLNIIPPDQCLVSLTRKLETIPKLKKKLTVLCFLVTCGGYKFSYPIHAEATPSWPQELSHNPRGPRTQVDSLTL